MDPMSQVFSLRWNNHRSNLLSVFDQLLQTQSFTDVTLAVDGSSIKCHKIVLAACSTYFQSLFLENTCEHPIVFLKDIKYGEIRALLDYMYKGEVNVAQEELSGLLKIAEILKIKGLVEEEKDRTYTPSKRDGTNVSSSTPHQDLSPNHGVSNGAASSSADKLTTNGGINGTNGLGNTRQYLYTPPGPTSNSGGDRRSQEVGSQQQQQRSSSSGSVNFPMWPLPGLFPGAHQFFSKTLTSPVSKESSPGVQGKRKKISGGSSSKDVTGSINGPSNAHPTLAPIIRDDGKNESVSERRIEITRDLSRELSRELNRDYPQDLTPREHEASRDSREHVRESREHVRESREHSRESREHSREITHEHTRERSLESPRDDDQDTSPSNVKNTECDPHYMEMMSTSMSAEKGSLANYVPSQRLEWKRYKQYTRNDIMAAIEEVKTGMSALQASRKYGVPSRTLYDKVKKMGIATNRQLHRKPIPGYSAAFPNFPIGKDCDSNDGADNSDLVERPHPDSTAKSTSPYQDIKNLPAFPRLQMMTMLEKMKESDKKNGIHHSDHPDDDIEEHEKSVDDDNPMNLTSMLAHHQRSQQQHRVSESSIPQSPSPSSGEGTAESPSSELQNGNSPPPANLSAFGTKRGFLVPPLVPPVEGSAKVDVRQKFLESVSRLHSLSGMAGENLPPRKRKLSQDVEATLEARKLERANANSPPNGYTVINSSSGAKNGDFEHNKSLEEKECVIEMHENITSNS